MYSNYEAATCVYKSAGQDISAQARVPRSVPASHTQKRNKSLRFTSFYVSNVVCNTERCLVYRIMC